MGLRSLVADFPVFLLRVTIPFRPLTRHHTVEAGALEVFGRKER